MNSVKRFQNIANNRLSMPVSILLSVSFWILTAILLPHAVPSEIAFFSNLSGDFHLPLLANRLLCITIFCFIGYFLIALNNTFGLIRTRATAQTSTYFLLVGICPSIHLLNEGNIAAVFYLGSLYFLLNSYQKAHPGNIFHSFAFLSMGSIFFPSLLLLTPVYLIGSYNFRSISLRSLCAALLGLLLPYWLLFAYTFCIGSTEIFYAPFRTLFSPTPLFEGFQLANIITMGYLFILFIASSGHCIIASYEDKIQTRSYLNFLIFTQLLMFIYYLLQPAKYQNILPVLTIGTSILTGHFFTLTSSKSANIFCIIIFIGLFAVYFSNIWMNL